MVSSRQLMLSSVWKTIRTPMVIVEKNPFAPTVVEFLKDRRYCDDEHLEQQGVMWKPELEVA